MGILGIEPSSVILRQTTCFKRLNLSENIENTNWKYLLYLYVYALE